MYNNSLGAFVKPGIISKRTSQKRPGPVRQDGVNVPSRVCRPPSVVSNDSGVLTSKDRSLYFTLHAQIHRKSVSVQRSNFFLKELTTQMIIDVSVDV